jgi:hypothetical protein
MTNIMDPACSRYNKFQRLKIIFQGCGLAWDQDSIVGAAIRLNTWGFVVQFLAGVEVSTLALVPTHTCIRQVKDIKWLWHDNNPFLNLVSRLIINTAVPPVPYMPVQNA